MMVLGLLICISGNISQAKDWRFAPPAGGLAGI